MWTRYGNANPYRGSRGNPGIPAVSQFYVPLGSGVQLLCVSGAACRHWLSPAMSHAA